MSRTLFAIYINDLSDKIKNINVGVYVGGQQLHMLMYADDIVLIAPNVSKAQQQLDILTAWCTDWMMKINAKKSEIMHVRNYQKSRCQQTLRCCDQDLGYAPKYKYLGYIMDECLNDKPIVEALTNSATRAFGKVVNIFRTLKNMGINSYESLYKSYILSIVNYSSAVWGFKEQTAPQVLQNRIQRFFMGVNVFAPVSALHLEFDWLSIKGLRWIEMVRMYNRITKMDNHRWPKIIHKWDTSLRAIGWANHIEHILAYANMDILLEDECCVDLDVLHSRLLHLERISWKTEMESKTKLRTFVEIIDPEEQRSLVKSCITRNQRSVLAKFKFGVLSLQLEIGRWHDDPIEWRVCRACDKGLLDDEAHFALYCDLTSGIRTEFLTEVHNETDIDVYAEKNTLLKNLYHKKCLRITAKYLEMMWTYRRNHLYQCESESGEGE